jgi:hypothetical protein
MYPLVHTYENSFCVIHLLTPICAKETSACWMRSGVSERREEQQEDDDWHESAAYGFVI